MFSRAAGRCGGAEALHPAVFESLEVTQPVHTPHLLELLAAVLAVKALRPYLLD